MGIFNRNQDKPQFDFDDTFPSSNSKNSAKPTRNKGMQSGEPKSMNPPPMAKAPGQPINRQAPPSNGSVGGSITRQKRKASYTIEDAIRLMRELPEGQREMVVSIVQKTLTSASISVDEIIEDASRKLSKLGARTSQLSKEIEELEAGIAERKKEIAKITKDTEETEDVKSSFEGVLAQEKGKPAPKRQQQAETIVEEHEEVTEVETEAEAG